MMRIECPWCGPRDEIEFRCGGEVGIVRPGDPQATSDRDWADYLFMRRNQKGPHTERWVHGHGCQQWFLVVRDTASHRIQATMPFLSPTPGGHS